MTIRAVRGMGVFYPNTVDTQPAKRPKEVTVPRCETPEIGDCPALLVIWTMLPAPRYVYAA